MVRIRIGFKAIKCLRLHVVYLSINRKHFSFILLICLTVLEVSLIIYRGGEEVMLDVGGQDATEAFNDVGHSDEARKILSNLEIGELKESVRKLSTLC